MISRRLKNFVWPVLLLGLTACAAQSQSQAPADQTAAETQMPAALNYARTDKANGFALIEKGEPALIFVDPSEHESVKLAASRIAQDFEALSGEAASVVSELPESGRVVVLGTLEHSSYINNLSQSGDVKTGEIDGVWEGFVQQTVSAGARDMLVIAGSDNRGAVYGAFDMIEKAGISPWSWWADVPVEPTETLYVSSGYYSDAPEVKYRGIFLNDENPALYGWVHETYGGFNADFYDRVFELILRNKGNYIWPAMWGKAIYDDDPQNKVAAARNGIVLGTSHHEPLMRAHIEWERYGEGPWDYNSNPERLREFWRGGMERVGEEDVLVTIGMRGDGDEAMTEGTAIELLETVVADQREIIADVTGEPAENTPQIWALYKEVQDYYDQGMEVPEDVLLLFADDNWGQLRRLPEPGAEREGGYGVYYHFDYVGGPRNYKWLNTTQIERVWEQMSIAREYGADELWIVNVGDLKPMELPIDFFLDYAWDPEAWPLDRLSDFTTEWAAQQFGPEHAAQIAGFVDRYTKYNSRRKPELLNQDTYSLMHYNEFENVVSDYNSLLSDVEALRSELDAEYIDAYNQLVWYPVAANANLNEMYLAAAKNALYAEQGRVKANEMADETARLFAKDAEITRFYHEDISDGKWNHFASQNHIGYTYWQQPDEQTMPEVTRIDVPETGRLGVSVAGTDTAEFDGGVLSLKGFDSIHQQSRIIEVFNTGEADLAFSAVASADWISLSTDGAQVNDQTSIGVSVDWDAWPAETQNAAGQVTILGPDGGAIATVNVSAAQYASDWEAAGFLPNAGVMSIPATDASCRVSPDAASWETVENLGLIGSAVTLRPAVFDDFAAENGPRLTYQFIAPEAGAYEVAVVMSPTLDFTDSGSMDVGISLNDGDVQTDSFGMNPDSPNWNDAVSHNAMIRKFTVDIPAAGSHELSVIPMDPGLIFQNIIIAQGAVPETYLGPPPSRFIGERSCN